MSYSSALGETLNQTVELSAFQSRDEYNKKTYSTSQITARAEGRRRQVTTEEGERLISNMTVITQTAVTVEDKIDGRRILEVLNMVDLDGNIIGYEVLLQ